MVEQIGKDTFDHLLLVPHGIRLYSQKVGCSSIDAYDFTSMIFKDVLKWVFIDYDIKVFSFIGLTLNAMQSRVLEEIAPIMEVESTTYENPDMIAFLKNKSIKVNFKGSFSKLPKYYKRAMRNLEKTTGNCDKYNLNVLVGYGPGNKSLFSKIRKRLSRDIFSKDPPDLMVSTAGKDFTAIFEKIPSNTKTFVSDKYFPELTKSDIKSFINFYYNL
ncbi:MAG: undecaprenyl diphosphate synthase family protein [Candidatus Methanofastidiosia archaeon]